MKTTEIRRAIKEVYGATARGEGFGSALLATCCAGSSCCGATKPQDVLSKAVGYTDEELESVPEGANLGLGCGNPTALASINDGDTVLDLGSGAGFDCFLAAQKAGATGHVIGVDMTPDMIEKARENARKGDYPNVEFRLGEIENLPVDDNSVDLVISNCVINLSTDKRKVFEEAFRVLKPGGRVSVSDIVLLKELPQGIRESVNAYAGCVAGALLKNDYLQTIKDAGFTNVEVTHEMSFGPEYLAHVTDPISQILAEERDISEEDLHDVLASIQSIKVRATKAVLA